MGGSLAMPDAAALALLPVAAVVGFWIAWSDVASMKIPNRAVMALALGFVVIAPLVLPLAEVGLRLAALVGVLLAGFVLSSAGALGAGDAKYLAAMAPYVARPDIGQFFMILALAMLAAFATHRILRALPAMRRATPGWASWTAAKFPLGLALGPSLAIYLAMAAAT
jgi:prepilin peptidase CpaA